jgi:hypothetical protein
MTCLSQFSFTHQHNWDTNGATIGECYDAWIVNPDDGFTDGPFKIKIKK